MSAINLIVNDAFGVSFTQNYANSLGVSQFSYS